MGRRIYLDFETRTDGVNVRDVAASKYAQHPSLRILCMAHSVDGNRVEIWRPREIEMPPDWVWDIREDDEFHAHNAQFERCIWQYHCVPKLGFSPIKLSQWRCTAAKAALLALPRSLDEAGSALGVTERKDKEGHKVMQQLTKPRKPTKNNPSRWFNDDERFEKLYAYCKQDVVTEQAIDAKLPAMPAGELNIWRLDQVINDRGILIDRKMAESAIKLEAIIREELHEELKIITNGDVHTAKQHAKMLEWLNNHGVNEDNLQAATVEKLLSPDFIETLSPDPKRVLEIRQALGLSSVAKYKKMLAQACDDDRVRDSHLYCGAGTRRWSGQGMQIQNFPRGINNDEEAEQIAEWIITLNRTALEYMFGTVMKALSMALRCAIIAPGGKKFIVCDFAGIEARVLAWLAGQESALQAFRDGKDIYVHMASMIYGLPYGDITKDQRFVGKQTVLGAGYQMGASRFQAQCASYGVSLDLEVCQEAIKGYREANDKVKQWWRDLQNAAINAALNPGRVYTARTIKYYRRGQFLFAELPSGGRISYYAPRVRYEDTQWGRRPTLSYMTRDSMTKRWVRTDTYGGKHAENIVQATSRDLLVHAMFRMERQGIPVVATIHDEVVCEVDEDGPVLADVEEIMTNVPTWAEGCPVGADGFECKRYRKAD